MRKTKRILSVFLILILAISSFGNSYNVRVEAESNMEIKVEDKDKDNNKETKWDKSINDEDRFIIKYKEDVTDEEIEKLIGDTEKKLKLEKIDKVKEYKDKKDKKDKKQKNEVYQIDSKDNLDEILNELENSDLIDYVQPDYKLFSLESSSGNDIESISETQVGNGLDIGINNLEGSIGEFPYILVGVLDTGIDIAHSELKDSIYINASELSNNKTDDDMNGYIDDVHGWDFYNNTPLVADSTASADHGTHIAGIIAAKDNGFGIVGVSPEVSILPMKFIENGNGYTSDAIEAIQYAESKGVSIMNCSWGSEYSNYALEETIDNSSMLFVASAGNNGEESSMYPAAYDLPNVISVGAVTSNGDLYTNSNYGDGIDVFAEGENVVSTLPNNKLGSKSGTSMATAFVSGGAALIKASYLNDNADLIKFRLTNNTTTNNFTNSLNTEAGILNIFDAFVGNLDEYNPIIMDENITLFEVEQILSEYDKYSEVKPDIQRLLIDYVDGYNEDFVLCEENDLDLSDSLFAIDQSNNNEHFELNEIISLFELFGKDRSTLSVSIYRFDTFTSRYLEGKSSEIYKGYILNGNDVGLIRPTYVVSQALDIQFTELYTDLNDSIDSYISVNNISLSNQDYNWAKEFISLYPVSIDTVFTYIEENDMTFHEMYEDVLLYETDVAILNGEILMPLYDEAGEEDIPDYHHTQTAPFLYNSDNHGSISKNSGSLTLSDNVINLEGLNGLDLELQLHYNSNNANLYKPDVGVSSDTDYTVIIYEEEIEYVAQIGYLYYQNTRRKNYDTFEEAEKFINETGIDLKYEEEMKSYNAKKTFNRTHENSRTKYYNEDGIHESSSPWSSPAPSSKDINESGYVGSIPKTGQALTTNNEHKRPDGTIEEVDQTWTAYYSGELSKTVEYISHSSTTWNEFEIIPYTASRSYYNKVSNDVYNEELKLGAGWSFNLPSIEFISGDEYLHLNGAVYKVNISSDSTDSNLEDYELKDIRLEKENGLYSFDGVSSSYTLYKQDGGKTYFDSNGKIIAKLDRYDNKINYQYKSYDSNKVLSKIIDTVGRVINIDYIDTSVGREVVFSLEDTDYSITYNIEKIQNESSNDYKLVKKTDSEGRETQFAYKIEPYKFNIIDKGNRINESKVVLLEKVTYPTESYTYFNYELYTKNFGDKGTSEDYRVSDRKEVDDSKVYNNLSFDYSDEGSTGYPNENDPSNLSESYTYWSKYQDNLGNEVKYIFNNEHLPVTIEKQVLGEQVQSIINEYNEDELVEKIISTNAGSNLSIVTKENFNYDAFGNLTEYWGPQAIRDSSNMPLNDEFKSTMTYNDTYHYLTSNIYKIDSNRTIKEEMVPSTDNKNIEFIKKYEKVGTQDYVLKEQAQLVYNNNVLSEKREYYDSNDWTKFNSIYYDYEDTDPTRNNMFDGLYLTKVWYEGVRDADDNLVDRVGASQDGTIETSFIYDYFGNKTISIDGKGNEISYDYDLLNRIEKVTYPDLTTNEWDYNDVDNVLEVTNRANTVTQHNFDGFGNVLSEVDLTTNNVLLTNEYDSYLRLEHEYNNLEENGFKTTYVYNPDGRVKSKTTRNKENELLTREVMEYLDAYDLNGDNEADSSKVIKTVVGDIDAPSIVTFEYYDKYGRLIRDGGYHDDKQYFNTYEYNYASHKTSEKTARAHDESWTSDYTSKFTTDYAGRNLEVENIEGGIISSEYNAIGQVIKVTDILGNTASTPYSSELEYDQLGRVIREKTPVEDNGSIVYSIQKHYYDNNGNVIKEAGTNNKSSDATTFTKTDYAYDSFDQLIKVVTYDDELVENYTQYFYDTIGNVKRMYTGLSDELTINGLDSVIEGTDHHYSITKYDYDHLGNLKKVIDPLGQEETYNYDKNNRMYEKTDKNGQLHEYDYDGLGRQLEHIVTTDSGMNTTSQEYTLTGALLKVTSDEGEQSFIYDDLGRVEEETDLDGTIKAYTYDSGNNRKTLDIQKGSQVITNMEYDYDEMNRLEYVYDNTVLQATYVYDANGNRDSLTLANGISTEYDYTIGNLLETLTNKNGETVLSTYTYTYYLDGNQESKTDQDNKVTMYVYDDLGRLTSESISGENTINYTYDDANNRKSKSIDIESVTDYSYDSNNQLKKETVISGHETAVTSYYYDNNGNQYSKSTETITLGQEADEASLVVGTVENTSVEFNIYNGFNQLLKVEKDGIVATYTYKANGIRDSKTVNGVTTHFILDGGRVVAELDDNDNINATYEYGINMLSVDNTDGFNYYIFNGHGDVIGLVNNLGAVVKTYDYDAFGIEKNPEESDLNPFRYSGEYFDKETGTYYLRARYYNPTIGRFITVDTYLGEGNDPLSLNLYTYCYNNPIRYYDPSGHMPRVLLEIFSRIYNRDGFDEETMSKLAITLNGGNPWVALHEIAQLNVAKQLCSEGNEPMLEFPIWGTRYEIDIMQTDGNTRFLWEVKPITKSGEKQLAKYMKALKRAEKTQVGLEYTLEYGYNIEPITGIPIIGEYKMGILSSTEDVGTIWYFFYKGDGIENPVKSTEVYYEIIRSVLQSLTEEGTGISLPGGGGIPVLQ